MNKINFFKKRGYQSGWDNDFGTGLTISGSSGFISTSYNGEVGEPNENIDDRIEKKPVEIFGELMMEIPEIDLNNLDHKLSVIYERARFLKEHMGVNPTDESEAIGINPDKRDQIDRDKFEAVVKALPFNQVIFCDGFLHNEIIEQERHCDVTLIRGFRSGYDADSDLKNIKFMKDAYEQLRVVFIACDSEFDYLSSSALRGIAKIDYNGIKQYIK
jgi:phosphopantetheine adenylyltransferase